MQQTLANEICAQGLGLHTGRELTVRLKPAAVGSGLSLKRSDIPAAPALKAVAANVTGTTLATTLGRGENSVSTIEHLLSALGALGVDNLLAEVDGPELPIFDGSAAEWLRLVNEAGLAPQAAPRLSQTLARPFRLAVDDKSIEARPAGRLSVEGHIDFGGFIGRQSFHYVASPSAYAEEISRARTFCLAQDVEYMRLNGLAKGGSLDNAVVVGDDGLLNPEGLRYRDEFVRHKILDFLGDLTLAGVPLLGHFTIRKSGHELNCRFVRAILAEPGLLTDLSTAPRHRRPARQPLQIFQEDIWREPIYQG
ncbi:MAG: UDP-3-O-acyl-N-acetylglucosamine deacetylase [Candidatus Adiutrix sp.]|jgi:UDP-3-O-[3-hydroxymyristoyl] N-acetylglucosamine deacetylase|nr:UDP-3-O-acyl-N-acetylglucosamine deacetylase [Candidatus Adiutrix sp.]